MGKRVQWVAYAIMFYQSGLAFTTLIWQPELFGGGLEWLLAGAFPVLLPGFFVVNRYLGCASGACQAGHCDADALPPRKASARDREFPVGKMPGM
jgi:hypothetical protein